MSSEFWAWIARRMELPSAGMEKLVREIRSSPWARYRGGAYWTFKWRRQLGSWMKKSGVWERNPDSKR